jgi:hypothetical protein
MGPQEAMVTTQWHGSKTTVMYFNTADETFTRYGKEEYLHHFFQDAFSYSNRWVNAGVLVAMIVLTRFGFYLCLKFKN